MSQLQAIAGRLRSLAQDASPLSANVQSSARQLNSLAQQVESLTRFGVNTGALLGAIQQAQASAVSAADAVSQVKSEGVAWADHLARGGGASMRVGEAVGGAVFGGGSAGRIGLATVAGHSSLIVHRRGENEWVPGSGEAIPAVLAQIEAKASPEFWARFINIPGPDAPGRDNNCVDCARAVESTWRGRPASSAAMVDANADGTSADRITDWSGGELSRASYADVERTLLELGDGASAIVVSSWHRGGGHAFNAVNDGGVVKFVDGQNGTVSGWPPISWHEGATHSSWAVCFDNTGSPVER